MILQLYVNSSQTQNYRWQVGFKLPKPINKIQKSSWHLYCITDVRWLLQIIDQFGQSPQSNPNPSQVDTIPIKLANSDSGSGIILFSYPHSEGILVKSITNNSPAQQLVWPQDLIIRINENVSFKSIPSLLVIYAVNFSYFYSDQFHFIENRAKRFLKVWN